MTDFQKAINERTPELPLIHIVAYCHDCKGGTQHHIREPYWHIRQAQFDWIAKHPGHDVSFRQPSVIYPRFFQRFLDKMAQKYLWPAYGHNADTKMSYVATASYTLGLASTPLASSSSRIAGREGNSVNNSSNYLDFLVSAKVTVGTTPTTLTPIEVGIISSQDDTPSWPDVIDGTDSDETFTEGGIKDAVVKIPQEGMIQISSATSNRAYYTSLFSVAALFGYNMPQYHVPWVAHSTVAALNSTANNHFMKYTPVYRTIS